MGNGEGFQCRECGYRIDVWYGGGMIDPFKMMSKTKKKVEDGEYGPWARKALENHPDASCYHRNALFKCICGNYASKSIVSIRGIQGDAVSYRPIMRCKLCHRKMKEVSFIPDELDCPRCGESMDHVDSILWD